MIIQLKMITVPSPSPSPLALRCVEYYILSGLPQILQIYDPHIWAIGTTEVALSLYLIMTDRD